MTGPGEVVTAPSRPVFLGCFLAIAAVVGSIAIAIFAIVFLESGADTGAVTMDAAAGYARGSVTRRPDRGFYLVRLPDGAFVALVDLDAANREAISRRCRALPVAADDPALPRILDQYASAFSPPAAGTTFVFREDCNGALYDVAGARLDGPGRNLDRYATRVNGEGLIVVETGRRTCSERDGADVFAEADC